MRPDPRPITFFLVWFLIMSSGLFADIGRFTSLDLYAGFMQQVAADPMDPDGAYAIALFGAVYHTADGGLSWSFRGGQIEDSARELVAHPTLPGWLYAGTLQGISRSRDGGVSWQSLALDPSAASLDVYRIAIDPFDAAAIYAVAFEEFRYVLFKSSDRGDTWGRIDFGSPGVDPLELAFDPDRNGLIYVGTRERIWRSRDGGATWEPAGEGLPEESVIALAVDESSLVVAVEGQLYRSADQGETFTPVTPLLPTDAGALSQLLADPISGTLIVRMNREIFRLPDGGTSWEASGTATLGQARDLDLAPDGLLWGSSWGRGIYVSEDAGATWAWSSAGIPGGTIFSLSAGGDAPDGESTVLYAGLERGGLRRSFDGGATWEWPGRELDFLTPLDLEADPHDPATIYATSDAGLWRSPDRGDSWQNLETAELGRIHDLEADPATPGTLYAASGADVWRSRDAGASWSRVLDGESSAGPLLIVASRPGTIYAAMGPGRDPVLSKTEDGGETWTQVLTSDSYNGDFKGLAVDPRSPDTVYAITRRSIYKTVNGGEDWRRLEALGRDLSTVAVDPAEPDTIWVGGLFVLWRSRDGGESWTELSRGHVALPRPDAVTSSFVNFRRLVIDPRRPDRPIVGLTQLGLAAVEIEPCIEVLTLQQGRFEVEIERNPPNVLFAGPGIVARVGIEGYDEGEQRLASNDSTVVSFFNPENWEMLLKVLDATRATGNFWVFLAAATDVGYTVEVTDNFCGNTGVYVNPSGRAAPAVTDTEAFPQCDFEAPSEPACTPGENIFCFGDNGRFTARVSWEDGRGGSGSGSQAKIPRPGLAQSDDSGIFYFFSPENWELLVKVLDGCAVNGHFWVFGAATTDVEYTLTVTDTLTGETAQYFNPQGNAADAINDTAAFATCP